MFYSVSDVRKAHRARFAMIIAGAAIALLTIAAIAATPSSAFAYGFKSTSATTNSITLTWDDPCASYSSLETTQYSLAWVDRTETDESKVKTQLLGPTAKSYTITGLKAGTQYSIVLMYAYRGVSSGTAYTGTAASEYGLSTRVTKPTGVKQTKWSYKNNQAYFTWNVQTGAKSIQCKLINVATGKAVLNRTFSYLVQDFYVYGMSKQIMYAVQMRVKDDKGWSAWSAKSYFLSQPLTNSKTKVAKNKLTVSWDKVKGAKKYDVYVSTKAKSGYKKVASVGSSKGKVTVSKFKKAKFSPKKTYYVYVQATKTVGGKKYTSGKHYAYKVKGSKGSMVYPF